MNVVVLGELCEDILMHNPNSCLLYTSFGAIPIPSALSPAALRTLIFMVLASTKTPF